MARKSRKATDEEVITKTLTQQSTKAISEIIKIRFIRRHVCIKVIRRDKLYYVIVASHGDHTKTFNNRDEIVESIKRNQLDALSIQNKLFNEISNQIDMGQGYDFNKKSVTTPDPEIGDLEVIKCENIEGDKWRVVELVDKDDKGENIWINYSESMSKIDAENLRKKIEQEGIEG